MQYLVHTCGDVVETQEKAYVIQASSEEEANEIAKRNFNEEYCVVNEEVYTKTSKRTIRSIITFAFLLIPIMLSFISWKNGHDTISISPDYISCLYAALFYLAFIVRVKGISKAVGSWIDIVFCVLIIALFSTFVKTILVTKTINLLWVKEISIDTSIVFPIALILTWLGLKVVGMICIAGVSVVALWNIGMLSEAMGYVYGMIYIICTFVGILMYLSVEPAVTGAFPNYKRMLKRGMNDLKNNFVEAGNTVANMANNTDKLLDKHNE